MSERERERGIHCCLNGNLERREEKRRRLKPSQKKVATDLFLRTGELGEGVEDRKGGEGERVIGFFSL